MNKVKEFHEKMVDFKCYGIVLLAVGAFFYLGSIIPSAVKSESSFSILTGASVMLLVLSIIMFTISKKYKQQLNNIEENHMEE